MLELKLSPEGTVALVADSGREVNSMLGSLWMSHVVSYAVIRCREESATTLAVGFQSHLSVGTPCVLIRPMLDERNSIIW